MFKQPSPSQEISNMDQATDTKSPLPFETLAKGQMAHEKATAPQASLEGLPAELRQAILDNMPGPETLDNLVHASPVYHALYRLDREKIWSQMAVRVLTTRGIDLSKEPASTVYVHLDITPDHQSLGTTLKDIRIVFQRLLMCMRYEADMQLSIPQSQALLRITDVVYFNVVEIGERKLEAVCSREAIKALGPIELFWGSPWMKRLTETEEAIAFPLGFQKYHGIDVRGIFRPRLDVIPFSPSPRVGGQSDLVIRYHEAPSELAFWL